MTNKEIKISKTVRFDLQRRAVSHMTSASWQNIPHVSYSYEPDITQLYEEFKKLAGKKKKLGKKLTFNTLLLKVIVEGLLAAPDLNAFIEYNHMKSEGLVHILENINISMPWLLPDGRMITLTIPKAETLSLNDITDYMAALSKKIEKTDVDELFYKLAFADTVQELKRFHLSIIHRIVASKITRYRVKGLGGKEKEDYYSIPDSERLIEKDVVSGTVTVSNVGSLYKEQKGSFALLEIIPPQVFAVGIGSVQERPGVYQLEAGKKEIGVRKILPMCLAFDHRAADFSSVIPFMKRLDLIFAEPEVIHKW